VTPAHRPSKRQTRRRILTILLGLTLAALHSAAAQPPGRLSPALFPGASSVLWIGAHPDDETLLAPLLGRLCLDEGLKCSFLVVSRGEAGHCLLPKGCKPDLATVRTREMQRAAAHFRAQLTLWNLPDGGASNGAWDVASGGHEALVARVSGLVARKKPDVVLTFDPRHGSTCHTDHTALGSLVLEAVARLPNPPATYLLETRVTFTATPFAMHFASAAPFSAGAFAFDANQLLQVPGRPAAWESVRDVMRLHPSQFSEQELQAIRAVPTRERAVYLGPASLLMSAPNVAACPP
jgi:LmbE family N-acetylglucosaminyl deacetylase